MTTQSPFPSPSCQPRAPSCAGNAQIIFPRLPASHFPAGAPSLLGSELAELSSLVLSTRNSPDQLTQKALCMLPPQPSTDPQGPAETPQLYSHPQTLPHICPALQPTKDLLFQFHHSRGGVAGFCLLKWLLARKSVKVLRRKSNSNPFSPSGFPADPQAQRSPGHRLRGCFPPRSKDSSFARASLCSVTLQVYSLPSAKGQSWAPNPPCWGSHAAAGPAGAVTVLLPWRQHL